MSKPWVSPAFGHAKPSACEFHAVAAIGRGVFRQFLLEEADGLVFGVLAQHVVGFRRQRGEWFGALLSDRSRVSGSAIASSASTGGGVRAFSREKSPASDSAKQIRAKPSAGAAPVSLVDGDAETGKQETAASSA